MFYLYTHLLLISHSTLLERSYHNMAIGRIPEPGTGIPESIIAAKGDLLTGTANDTPAVLTVGANGTTLVADSGEATGLKWATPSSGGMTLISTTTLTGASTTLSSIPQTYNYLYLVIFGVTNATANGSLRIDANGSNILGQGWGRTAITAVDTNLDDRIYAGQANNGDILRTSADNVFLTRIYNYTSATNFKNFDTVGYFINGSSVKTPGAAWGGLSTNSAITSIVLRQSGGNFSTGTALLYGVK
jgi:hypothetical protein